MSVVMDASVPSEGLQLGEVLTTGVETTVTLTHVVPEGTGTAPYFWATGDLETFERSVRSDHRVSSLRPLHTIADSQLYRLEWAPDVPEFISIALQNDVRPAAVVGSRDGWQFRMKAISYRSLAHLRHECTRSNIPLSIDRVETVRSGPNRPYGLTDKQLEMVLLAFDEGYFEVPRRTTLTELAATTGVSDSAAAHRLRRGLSSLIRHTMIGTEDEPLPRY